MQTITIVYTIMFFFGIYFLLIFLILYSRNRKDIYSYPPADKDYSLSIIIPCYNEEKNIGATIESLLNSDYKNLKKIIIVDDCSKDNSYKIIKEYAKKNPKILAVQTPKNTGNAAGAKNYGVQFVKTELIGFSDSDSFPNPDAISKMIGYFDNPKVAAVTSRVLVKNSKNFLERFQDFDYAVIAWGRKILDFIDSVYVTNGPLSIYRTKVFIDSGCFDEKNLTEDIEITWNLLSKGYKTKMSYSSIVYTIVPDNLKQWVNQRIRWNLGGLQTLNKYKKFCFKGKNAFGYFVLSYVGLAFFLALVGFFLLFRWVFLKIYFYLWTMPFLIKGYNPFEFLKFNFLTSILFIFSTSFLILSLVYYLLILKDTNLKSKGIITIIVYTFIYRPLYIIPLLGAIYRIHKKDLRWYTK
ncbi:glycosyltransferase family 2 protein [Candidatus Pacearchaeota archaeon]|nr:glycosyltransferase family 2 protein [Candidatus Pacearchaeota archaeon]